VPTVALILAALRTYVCPTAFAARPKKPRERETELTRREALFDEAAQASAEASAAVEPGQTALPDMTRSVWWQGYMPHLTPGAAATPWATPQAAEGPVGSPLGNAPWSPA